MLSPPRLIAHLDMDAFYASVELLRYPELAGLPVVIGGGSRHRPEETTDPVTGEVTRRFTRLRDYVGRGVATTATYAARSLGVNSAAGLMKAARLAPDAILLPTDFDAYRRYSRAFKAAVRAIAPQIENSGIDEIEWRIYRSNVRKHLSTLVRQQKHVLFFLYFFWRIYKMVSVNI